MFCFCSVHTDTVQATLLYMRTSPVGVWFQKNLSMYHLTLVSGSILRLFSFCLLQMAFALCYSIC